MSIKSRLIYYRTARVTDLTDIQCILKQTWHHAYSHMLSEDAILTAFAQWHHSENLIEEIQNPKGYFGLVCDANQPFGLISMTISPTRDTQELEISQAAPLTIGKFYIHPRYQRQGFGKNLLEHALKKLPKETPVRLDVEQSNTKGIAFYTTLGFKQITLSNRDIESDQIHTISLEIQAGKLNI